MKTSSSFSRKKTFTIGNTKTGHHYCVGLCNNGIDYYAGQTFKTYTSGNLKMISIFPELIIGDTDALLSVFEFDANQYVWKQKKTECRIMINKKMERQWVNFNMNDTALEQGRQYAFKISCNHGGMIAVAECPWKEKDPYPDGVEWIGSSENPEGKFHPNFDLSFIAEIESN